MNAIQTRTAPISQQPRHMDRMSAKLVTSQADSIRDLVIALGETQHAETDASGSVAVSLQGKDGVRYTKDAKGMISSLELNSNSATPTKFHFENEQWPHLTSVTVGATTFAVDPVELGWGTPGERIQLDSDLAELLKGNAYTTRDLALALDNSSADRAPGIGWVQVPGQGNTSHGYPLSFQYDRDGQVAELATSVGDYSRAEYSFFQGDLGSIAQRNSSYVTIDNNVFDFNNGQPTAYRYAAWTEQHPVGE